MALTSESDYLRIMEDVETSLAKFSELWPDAVKHKAQESATSFSCWPSQALQNPTAEH